MTRRPMLVALLALAALAACEDEAADDASARTVARPADVRPTPTPPERWAVGRAATEAEIAAVDVDVNPQGVGLPAGRGTHGEGARVYAQRCAACHGARGEGTGSGATAAPRLVGREPREGFPFGQDPRHVKTIGNYWPYATTVFDYVRRAMPLGAAGTLTSDELYAVTAFLLAENEIVARDAVLDARSLPQVRMPARDRFVPDDRKAGAGFR